MLSPGRSFEHCLLLPILTIVERAGLGDLALHSPRLVGPPAPPTLTGVEASDNAAAALTLFPTTFQTGLLELKPSRYRCTAPRAPQPLHGSLPPLSTGASARSP